MASYVYLRVGRVTESGSSSAVAKADATACLRKSSRPMEMVLLSG